MVLEWAVSINKYSPTTDYSLWKYGWRWSELGVWQIKHKSSGSIMLLGHLFWILLEGRVTTNPCKFSNSSPLSYAETCSSWWVWLLPGWLNSIHRAEWIVWRRWKCGKSYAMALIQPSLMGDFKLNCETVLSTTIIKTPNERMSFVRTAFIPSA